MRSDRCLSRSLALVFCLACSAAYFPGVTLAQAPAGSDSSAADAHSPDQAEVAEPALRTVKVLPSSVAPNPPKPEELAASGLTWKGEYEADVDGKPLLGPDARPLPVLYNKKGKRLKSKIKVPKTHPITIASGTLTVDGWTGKARLNYDIPDLKYIYLSAPSLGTVVVSQAAFPGATEQKGAFHENTLTVTMNGHEFQLASDKPLLSKKPESAWVRFDPAYTEDPRYPIMGYGSASTAPYEWPGAKQGKTTGVAAAPALPSSMQPRLATPVCITNCGAKQSAAAAEMHSPPASTPAPAAPKE